MTARHRGPGFARARRILAEAVATGAFPGGVAEVGRKNALLWREAFGRLEAGAAAPPAETDTPYDLASLTKVLATGPLFMRLLDEGRIDLDDPISRWIPAWRSADRESATVRDLLAHCAGLTAHLPFYRDIRGRPDFERAISTLALEYVPRSQAVYSDLGFILLGFIAENAGDEPLRSQVERLVERVPDACVGFGPIREGRERVAPTEVDPWRGRLLRGEVHDGNAWALGGAAGHAGLFGTAEGVGALARVFMKGLAGEDTVLGRAATIRRFSRKQTVAGSSRALAWDTMLPTSSCGVAMRPTAIGHTGFTGTSLWIDWESDVYVVLLTNRVHPSAANETILGVRPAFHDAVMEGART